MIHAYIYIPYMHTYVHICIICVSDHSPGLIGGPWHMMHASGQQPFYPYPMMMMPGMYPMQNMRYPYDGTMQTLITANMTVASTSSPSRSLTGAAVAHPIEECKPFSCLLIPCFRFSD